jgi:hypothetical protein
LVARRAADVAAQTHQPCCVPCLCHTRVQQALKAIEHCLCQVEERQSELPIQHQAALLITCCADEDVQILPDQRVEGLFLDQGELANSLLQICFLAFAGLRFQVQYVVVVTLHATTSSALGVIARVDAEQYLSVQITLCNPAWIGGQSCRSDECQRQQCDAQHLTLHRSYGISLHTASASW